MNPETARNLDLESDLLDVVTRRPENIAVERLVWLSSCEAADYLRKSPGALRVMVHRGQIHVRRFRRRLYFKRRELDQLLETPTLGRS